MIKHKKAKIIAAYMTALVIMLYIRRLYIRRNNAQSKSKSTHQRVFQIHQHTVEFHSMDYVRLLTQTSFGRISI